MDRRKFITGTSLCAGALCFGCGLPLLQKKEAFYPNSVKIESCTICQLNCPKCWRVCDPNRMPLGYLKFEDFKKFVDKNRFIKDIELSSQGEMFLNPDLNKIISYGYEKGINLYGTTGVNLNTLSDETAELLVSKKFNNLFISIDGASQETYSIYRRGGDFNKVIENIKKIQFYQKKYNDFQHPRIVWKMIIFGHNEHEIPKAKQIAKELGIPIEFAINIAGDYSPIKNLDFVEKETGLDVKALNHKDYDNSYYDIVYKSYLKTGQWFYCTALLDQPIIFYDGKYIGCCFSYYKNSPDINVFEIGLKKALDHKEIKKLKNIFALKEKNTKGTMCEGCDVLKYIEANNHPITEKNNLEIKAKAKENRVG